MTSDSTKQFLNACATGHLEVVKRAVEEVADNQTADIHARNDWGVRVASYKGHLEVVAFLKETAVNEAVRIASENGELDVAKALVEEQQADIHTGDDWAIRRASRNGHLELVQYLVGIGANVCAMDNWAVKWASYNGHLNVVQYLVSQGADIHAENDWAMRFASYKGHLDVVKYLTELGANVHADDDYAVRLASYMGHLQVVEYLVSQGADSTAKDHWAIRMAKLNGHERVAEVLTQHDVAGVVAKPDAPPSDTLQRYEKANAKLAELKAKVREAEAELESCRESLRPLCTHPFRVDDRFKVCGVCYNLMGRLD
jgi:Ankyrin repeats (3 copies)